MEKHIIRKLRVEMSAPAPVARPEAKLVSV